MPQFIDFDAARAERENEPIAVVKAGGREISIPRPSAEAVFNFFRLGRDQSELSKLPAQQQLAKTLALFEDLFTPAILIELGKAGLDNAELNELAGKVCAAAMSEGSPPNRKARRAAKSPSRSTSSRGGRTSRPTSRANTRSTSAST